MTLQVEPPDKTWLEAATGPPTYLPPQVNLFLFPWKNGSSLPKGAYPTLGDRCIFCLWHPVFPWKTRPSRCWAFTDQGAPSSPIETFKQGVESTGRCCHSTLEVGFLLIQAEVGIWEGGQRASPAVIEIQKCLLWLKSPKMTTSNAGKACGATGTPVHSGGNAKWYRCFGRRPLTVSYETKHSPAIPFSNCTPTFNQVSWKLVSTQKPVHECLYLWQLYSKLPRLGGNPDVLQ